MNIIQYIKDDLKKSNISDYNLEIRHLKNTDVPEIIDFTNSIVYVFFLKASDSSLKLTSDDFFTSVLPNETNESVFKFLNSIRLRNVLEIKYIKVDFIRE